MIDSDDDAGSQAELDEDRDETPHSDCNTFDDKREKLLREWADRFEAITQFDMWESVGGDGLDDNDPAVRAYRQWIASHDREDVALPTPGGGTEIREIYLMLKPGCTFSTTDKAFERFARYSETVSRRIKQMDSQHSGSTLADIGEDDRRTFLLDGQIPTAGITLDYGRPKTGKSAWAHKLAICCAFGLDFDGEAVTHGRVMLVTLDPGARKRNVKPRLMEICNRLSVKPNENLVIVDDPVILNDPASVESLLRKNPGEFVLIIIDPLYKAIIGELTQQSVMEAASEGMKMLAVATGAAVLILHHEGRGDSSHAYGSIFLDAAVDAGMHTVRKDDRVVVTPDPALFKNVAAREAPFVYRIEGPYLESINALRDRKSTAAPSIVPDVPHADMLALIPTTATTIRGARKLIEHLLSGGLDARRKQWERVRADWAAAGLIVQRGGTIRRVAP
jgi:hypothetical protein